MSTPHESHHRSAETVRARSTGDLHDEHVEVLRMIKILEAVHPRVGAGETIPAGDWTDIIHFLQIFVDRCHHGKEEQALFPALMNVADQEARALVQRLLGEHQEARRLVSAFAIATGTGQAQPGAAGEGGSAGGPLPEGRLNPAEASRAIAEYAALMRPHIASEERHLFPTADRVLPPDAQERIEAEYDRIEEEVVGPGRHEAFELAVERLTDEYLPAESRVHGFRDEIPSKKGSG